MMMMARSSLGFMSMDIRNDNIPCFGDKAREN